MTTRIAALWVPDWPVVAAMSARDVPWHIPAAIHDGRRLLGKMDRERAHACAHFQHDVALVELGRFEQHAQKIQIDEEILAQFCARPNPDLAEPPHEERKRLILRRSRTHLFLISCPQIFTD